MLNNKKIFTLNKSLLSFSSSFFGTAQPAAATAQSSLTPLKFSNMVINERKEKLTKPDTLFSYGFGQFHTDHMLEIDFHLDKGGWGNPVIKPYGPMDICPSASVLHYGISVFEGMPVNLNEKTKKPQGYKTKEHMESFYRSCDHLDLPLFDLKELQQCIQKLVQMDIHWYPDADPDQEKVLRQMYIRLIHFATEPSLGVKSARHTKIVSFLNPMKIRQAPRKVKCSHNVIKNWAMGHGEYRLSGNFGPCIPTVTDAKNNGFDDVLWLIDDYIQEMTILNVFFLIKSRFGQIQLLTPVCDGTVFNGNNRQSILQLKDELWREKGVEVVEKKISIHEVISAFEEDRLVEAFGISTANFIQSLGQIVYQNHNILIKENGGGITEYLTNKIMSIKVGDENHPWITPFY